MNRSATSQVQVWRACALWRTNRVAEAQQAMAEVLMQAAVSPGPAMDLRICLGDIEAARSLVIARLADENTREWALRFVQPAGPSAHTPLERLLNPITLAVRTAPDVVRAATTVGRILPQPVNTELPAGFDPFQSKPRMKPPGPGEV